MERTTFFIVAATMLALIPLVVAPIAVGRVVIPATSADLSVLFPANPDEAANVTLAEEIAAKLGLGTIVSNESIVYDESNPLAIWYDGLNNTVPLRGYGAPAAPQTVVRVATSDGYVVELHYSAASPVDGSNGSFLFADVRPFPGNLSSSATADVLRSIAGSLGIALNGEEQVREYVYGQDAEGDSLRATLYRNINGTSVAFANQIWIRARTTTGTIEVARLFPWVSPTTEPRVSPDEAFAIASSHANATVNSTRFRLSEWEFRGFVLDPRVYRLAYFFSLSYPADNPAEDGVLLFQVGIDVQTGGVLFSDFAYAVPGVSTPRYGALALVAVFLVAFAILVAVGLARSESARFSLFSLLTVSFLSLRRERALQHFVRGQIYEYLRSHPGATFSDIRDDLSLKNGTAAHHLMVLVKMDFLVAKREGRLKHFFRADTPDRTVAIALSPLQYEMLDLLAERELTQAELAERLSVSRQRIHRNVRALETRHTLTRGTTRRGITITSQGRSMVDQRPSD